MFSACSGSAEALRCLAADLTNRWLSPAKESGRGRAHALLLIAHALRVTLAHVFNA